VRALLDTFVASSIGAGRSDRQNAEVFLEQQVAEYARRLSDSEQRLADFKKKNLGLMPDQRGDYFARLQGELAARNKIRSDLAVAIQQRDQFVRKIGSGPQGVAATTAAPTMQQVQSAQALDARIREAHSSLDALLDKYTDRHPQVVSEREMILRLEEQRQAELGHVRITNPTRTEASPIAVDAVVQNLQIALNNVDVQIATLDMQLKHSESQLAELQRTVTVGAEIEAGLARLNRDYGVTKAQYESLLQRLESAHISNDADRSDKLRFKILEPPRVALRPMKPNRPLLLAGVLFGATSLGAGVALLRAQTRSVFFSRAAVSASLNLPVIGTVSKAYSAQERSAQLRGYLAYGIAVSLLVAFVTAAAAFNFPLSQLLRHTIGMGVE
jgi:polysaccharide chain length determinant protein (PEP-CTERM system associated)